MDEPDGYNVLLDETNFERYNVMYFRTERVCFSFTSSISIRMVPFISQMLTYEARGGREGQGP
jgi:hypothetical protein